MEEGREIFVKVSLLSAMPSIHCGNRVCFVRINRNVQDRFNKMP